MRPQIAQPRGFKVTLATFVWFVFNDRHSCWICLVIYRHIMIPNILFHHHPVNDVVLCWTVVSIWDNYYMLIFLDWKRKEKWNSLKYFQLLIYSQGTVILDFDTWCHRMTKLHVVLVNCSWEIPAMGICWYIMVWWHGDMMTWWHGDVMIWGHDSKDARIVEQAEHFGIQKYIWCHRNQKFDHFNLQGDRSRERAQSKQSNSTNNDVPPC